MKENKRKNVEDILVASGSFGVRREVFESDRQNFGTSFLRRIEELEEKWYIEKESRNKFITKWTLAGLRPIVPKGVALPKLMSIGSVCGFEFFEVAA